MCSAARGGFRFGVIGLVAVLVVAGCAARSTIETRQQERAAAYAALSPEEKAQVDEGQIAVGMSEDAVYIAWGQPAQVMQSGDSSGVRTTWLYHGTTSDDYLRWHYYPVPGPGGSRFLGRTLVRDTSVREYVSAELVFREGKLESWRTLPRPPSETYYQSSP